METMKPINDCFLRALKREKTDFTPVWLMRQAGRYLPEYCETRARAGSFMGLAMNPDYATEVTLQPIDRYGLDAAILFSDILTVPDAMGLGLHFVAGEGPIFDKPVQSEEAVKNLFVPDPNQELRYVMDAVSSIRKALNNRVPLIGFSGSPFTLACYMIEGRGSRDFRTVKTMMYRRPDLFDTLIAMSGLFHTRDSFPFYSDELTYANSPQDFLQQMPYDHPWMKLYRQRCIVFTIGQGRWEDITLESTREMDRILKAKGIPAWFDYWGYDCDHDWPWWQKQLPHVMHNIKPL